jgi:hypothetical protein
LIVHRELVNELELQKLTLERGYDEYENCERTIEALNNTAIYRFVVLIFQITLTFLIQGMLIWMVWTETPDPDDSYQPDWNADVNGLCSVSVFLQLAAIGTLCLWTMSSFTDILTELRCYISRTYSREIVLSGRYNLRRIEGRSIYHHVAIALILIAEFFISMSMFVAGVNFVLSQIDAADIVQGVLGISFIVDIDNKVYENSFIDEDDPGNIKIVLFRTTQLDIYDTLMSSLGFQDEDLDTAMEYRKKARAEKASGHSQIVSQAAMFNGLQWPVLIVVVVTIVIGMRGTYCGDFDPNNPHVP